MQYAGMNRKSVRKISGFPQAKPEQFPTRNGPFCPIKCVSAIVLITWEWDAMKRQLRRHPNLKGMPRSVDGEEKEVVFWHSELNRFGCNSITPQKNWNNVS